MNKITFYASKHHINMLKDLCKIPFAKTDDGYRFAYWVYDLNDNEDKRAELLESPHGEEVAKLLEQTKSELSAIVISEDDYLGWTVHKKESGGIKQYHKIIHDLSMSLIMLSIDCSAELILEDKHKKEIDFYAISNNESSNSGKTILNRNNPFADVTIKSQQFFYKTADGDTETLFFNTNDIVEKVDKNDKNMFTMRPSFSVTKEHGVVQKPMQKVTFANSIVESIVSNDDYIYVHID